MDEHPLIISYYTPDYERHASALKRSAEVLGLRTQIEPRASTGSWVENCGRKANFVREIRERTKEPVLWVDADAIIRRPLDELKNCDADFAVVKRQGWSFYGGQIYFGTGAAANAIVDRWCAYSRNYPDIWDQVTLGYAWWDESLDGNTKVKWLPESIFAKLGKRPVTRLWQQCFSKAAIWHKQASRTSETKPLNFGYDNYRIPQWWRDAAAADRPFPLNAAQRAELGLLENRANAGRQHV